MAKTSDAAAWLKLFEEWAKPITVFDPVATSILVRFVNRSVE
jgi:hypothetical protein